MAWPALMARCFLMATIMPVIDTYVTCRACQQLEQLLSNTVLTAESSSSSSSSSSSDKSLAQAPTCSAQLLTAESCSSRGGRAGQQERSGRAVSNAADLDEVVAAVAQEDSQGQEDLVACRAGRCQDLAAGTGASLAAARRVRHVLRQLGGMGLSGHSMPACSLM